MRISMLASSLLLCLAAACSKSEPPAPACADVVDHVLAVTKIKYAHEGMELGDRKGMVAQCEKDQFTPEMRRCLMAAKNTEEVGTCRGQGKPALPKQGTP